MRHIKHLTEGTDKILNIETEGCTINVVIGTHDPNGIEFTTVEITPHEPDGEGRNWGTIGPTAVIVVPLAGLEPESSFYRELAANQPTH
jgi:hypothetical protein